MPTLPQTKPIILCDDVLIDSATGKVHLLGVFNNIRPHAQPPYPHWHREFCVFLQLSDARGNVAATIRIVHADALQLVYETPVHQLVFPDPQHLVRANFRIRNCRFEQPGIYWVELYCNGQFLTDRVLRLL
jgi:hypothetical protein